MKLRPFNPPRPLPGVSALEDALRRLYFKLDDTINDCRPVFIAELKRWGRGRHKDLRAAGRLILNAIICEGVRDVEQLSRLLGALNCSYRTSFGVMTFWAEERWPACRLLANPTVLALDDVPWPVSWEHELRLFDDWLRTQPSLFRWNLDEGGLSAITTLIKGSLAFFQGLPQCLFAELIGYQQLSSISMSCHARGVSQLALSSDSASAERAASERESPAILEEACFRAGLPEIQSASDITVNAIFDIMSPTARGGIGSDKRARLKEIATAFNATAANDVNGNTAVAYSIFLLTIGTPGSADAAIVTASRCFRSLKLACDKLEGGFATLLTLSDEELVEQYRRWLDEPDANKYLKQAIGAFHYFLVQQLGASPLWLRGKAVGIKVPAAAQLLWRHEDESLRTHFASIERADRVDRMSTVIFELARDVPLRISDLRRMKVSDLRTVGNDLMLDIREFRNAPRPKTRDTLRSVKITSPSARRLLEAWRDERLEDLCGEDDQVIEGAWLFGDGFDLKSQVDLAKSYANVTRLLRQLTGDPAIGFHALRHTCISWLMLEALLSADEGTEWDPLDPVAVRAGHASAYSSLTSYFHLAMVAMRARMDRLLRPHVTNRATADWCGMKENTLTIRSKRNPAQDEMTLALKTAAAGVSLPSVADSFVLQAAVLVKGGPAPLGVVELLEIITRLDEDKDVNSVANSSGRTVEEIRVVAKFRERVRVVYPCAVHRTKWRNKGKLTPFLAYLDRHAKEPATTDGLDAWLQLMDGGKLDASDSRVLEPLLHILHIAEISPSTLSLRTARPDSDIIRRVTDLFVAVMGSTPNIDTVRARGDRLDHYLLLSGAPGPADLSAPSARCAMTGFHAVMVALFVQRAMDVSDRAPKV